MMRLARALGVPACLFVLLGAAAPLPVRIAWTSVPTELAPILFAQKDLLDHQGVTYAAEPVHFSDTAPILRALAADQIDLAPLAPNALGVAIQNAGLDDLRVVADEYQDGARGHYSSEFMVQDPSPIRAVEDLRGKVLAVEAAGGMSEMALRVMLGRHGVAEPGAIDLVMAPLPSQGAMLEQGKIDLAALGAPFSYVLKSRGTVRTLFTLADALGPTDALMLVARADFLARNRAALDDFFEDYVSARRWLLAPAHRDEAVRIVAQASRVPAELLDEYLFTDGDYFRDRDARPDPAALQRSLDLLRQAGFLDIAVDANTLCDPSFIDEAARRLK
jgi:NitT/TauT family transport system substrate-binding protein